MNKATVSGERLPVRVKMGFGVADLGGNLFFTAMGFWSMYYLTDVVGIPAAMAGLAVMLGKIWDAVTDPVMGYISDRTVSRMGRRRPYIVFGAIPLMLTMIFFFKVPGFTDPVALTVWATIALCLLNTAYTIVNVPYASLTPELTKDYNERTSLNGYRFGFAVIGTILGAGVVLPLIGMAPTKGQGFLLVGIIFGVLMAVTSLITGLSVKEKHRSSEVPHGFFKTYSAVFTNKPYLILLFTYALNLTGLNFLQGILAYYFKYVFRNEGLTTIAMLMLLVVAMLFIPVSVLVAKRIGKKRTYQICFAILAAVCLAIFFLGHRMPPAFTIVLMVFGGVGIGFGYVPPYAMLPDTVEVEAAKSGRRNEGAYYGIWTLMSKLGTSAATAMLGFILAAAHYVPDVPQGPDALFAIRLLVGPIPAVILVLAAVLVQFYPLDEVTYEALIAQSKSQDAS